MITAIYDNLLICSLLKEPRVVYKRFSEEATSLYTDRDLKVIGDYDKKTNKQI